MSKDKKRMVMPDIESAIKLREKYQKDWNRYVKLYMGERVNVVYEGDFNPFVMESHTIVESIVAHIAGGKHEIGYLPSDSNQTKETKPIEELVNYWLEKNNFGLLKQLATRESVIKGNAYWYVEWNPDKKCPDIRLITVDDMILDPTATSVSDSRYVGHTYLASLSDLKNAKAVDPKTGKIIPKYKNLRNLGKIDAEKLNPYVKKKLEDSTLGQKASKDQVVVDVLYYTDGSIVEVANRSNVIRDAESPYQREAKTQKVEISNGETGEVLEVDQQIPEVPLVIPYAEVRGFINPHTHYSHGEMSLIADRQEHLNELEAQDLDNVQYINNVMGRIDPQYEGIAEDIKSRPGYMLAVPRGAFEFLERPVPNIDLDMKKNEIKDEMRRVTGADEIIQGVSTERSRVTATEVGTQLEQSARRFRMRIDNMQGEGLSQLGIILLRLAQLFVDQDTMVRIVGNEGVEFKNFDPYEYQGDYEPIPKLQTTIDEQRRELDNRMQPAWELILTDPQINRREAVRMFLSERGFEEENIKSLLGGPNGIQPQIPGAQGGLPPEQGLAPPPGPL